MIHKHYDRREHFVYFLIIAIGFFVLIKARAATSIGTNVQSDGNFLLNTQSSIIQFANGWRISQTTATTSQVNVLDSASSSVLIFVEN